MFQLGQGLFGRIPFRDGTLPAYDRPYLIVSLDAERIGLLNVSSVAGKENKLLYKTNRNLVKYNPPFIKNSFVKLDSLVYVTPEQASSMLLLSGGKTLDQAELTSVIASIL